MMRQRQVRYNKRDDSSGDSNVTLWKKGIDGKWYQMEGVHDEATTSAVQQEG